jgi:hypothetical protein
LRKLRWIWFSEIKLESDETETSSDEESEENEKSSDEESEELKQPKVNLKWRHALFPDCEYCGTRGHASTVNLRQRIVLCIMHKLYNRLIMHPCLLCPAKQDELLLISHRLFIQI